MKNILTLITLVIVLGACDEITKQKKPEPNMEIYNCSGLSVLTSKSVDGNTVVLNFPDQEVKLIVSEAGKRFSGKTNDDRNVVLLENADKTTISIDPNTMLECTKTTHDENNDIVYFKALGHEPEWNVIYDSNGIVFNNISDESFSSGTFDKNKNSYGVIEIKSESENNTIIISIENKICRDNMSGQYHYYTVQVSIGENNYKGCGFSMLNPTQALLPI